MTHSDELVERVAKLMATSDGTVWEQADDTPGDAVCLTELGRNKFRSFARAALSALPSHELLRDALEALEYIALITNRAPAISHEREIHIRARAAADKIRAAMGGGNE